MQQYVRFDAEAFIKDSRCWKKRRKHLEEELEMISPLPAANGVGHKTDISKPTESAVMMRSEINNEIETLDYWIAVLDKILQSMPQELRDVLDVFFFGKGYVSTRIEQYGNKYAMCRSDVYKQRRLALDYIAEQVTDKYLE